MKFKKTAALLVSTIAISIALVGCGKADDTEMAKNSAYFNIPWGMTTTEFIKNNPDIRFGQNNGKNAATNEYSVELFDSGYFGDMSTYYIDDKLISIHVDLSKLIGTESEDFMLNELQLAFGEHTDASNTTGEFKLWENSEMTVEIFTESTYAHVLNKMFINLKIN